MAVKKLILTKNTTICSMGKQPPNAAGRRGTLLFFHHRLAHAGNPPNYSHEIRKAVIGDLVKKELKEKLDEPPCENMWQDWPGIPTDD